MQKIHFLLLAICLGSCAEAQTKKFDILSFPVPAKFKLLEEKKRIVYQIKEGNTFCQVHLWPAQQGSADPEANFKTDWDYFAGNQYKIGDPKEKQTEKQNGWNIVTGVGIAELDSIQFIISVSTFTQADISWCAITQFNDEKYTPDIDKLLGSINADTGKFVRKNNNAVIPVNTGSTGTFLKISKPTTHFDDSWVAKALSDYVLVSKAATEIRLHYIDKALDEAKSNMVDVPEYYWSKYVEPYFTVSNPQKWGGAEYPIIYFMQASAVDKRTGKSCHVALKVVLQGGSRPIIAITPNKLSYQEQFPHPNDLNQLLARNKFALTAKDITGVWESGGGGYAEYYNAYTGGFAFINAISAANKYTFNSNGSYSNVYRSAVTNGGYTQFGGQDFSGQFTVNDWGIRVSNHFGGKTKNFHAQFMAVKGGCLLYLENTEYSSENYTFFKTK